MLPASTARRGLVRAFVQIRQDPLYRREAFEHGLQTLGYEIHGTPRGQWCSSDLLLIWNRYGQGAQYAAEAEACGATVIIAENGYLGRDWRGEHWYALALNYHNGAGDWRPEGPERWESWNVPMAPWRSGSEIVVLQTRGIGPTDIAEPQGWSQREFEWIRANTKFPVRMRMHPGETPCIDLEYDLKDAAAVVTWGSGAALKALLWGIPVFHGFPRWIGAGAAQPWQRRIDFAHKCRLDTFQSLAWSMWTTDEIATGGPMARLLR